MKKIILFMSILISFQDVFGMTKAQLKKTMTIMKNQCVQKLGIDESKIANVAQGEFREDPEVKCYVACVYKTIQVTKNDRLNKEMVNKQVDILYPPEIKEPAKATIASCMPVQENYNEFCERVFYAAKCLYETNPAHFIFP